MVRTLLYYLLSHLCLLLTRSLRVTNRNLRFLADGFRFSLSTPKEELKDSFKRSYESTLKQHHGFVVKNLVGVRILSSLCFLLVARSS